ncbi:MAG: DNA methyltransferase, partial [Candidatus Uhrbacteria bacterium]
MPAPPDDLQHIPHETADLHAEFVAQLRALYPPLFDGDGKLSERELRAFVANYGVPDTERFEFRWAGKAASKRIAFTSSRARLRPNPKRGVDGDATGNCIIEGDNLEVLKLLRKSYYGKVKCIYIDPPYNTGHDFVYSDNFTEGKQAYWEQNGVFRDGMRMDTNSESAGRYHSNWLNMMQSRLLLARQLLRANGVIFISIDDHEVHNLRKLMDEVFGE